ncbi:hypothetical protein N665_0494s0001, partial [Sinapis alba]
GGDGNDGVRTTDGKLERFYCTVSASEVVKSHPGYQLSSYPPPYFKAALSVSSESDYYVLPITSCSDMYIHSSLSKGLAPDNSEPLLRWSHH